MKTKLFIFFRFRREILYQLPPLERFLMTISSIWCHLWKSTHTRPVRFSVQSSVLESSFDTPTPWAGEHNVSTPVFHPTAVEHSQTYCLQASTLQFFFWKKMWVVLWQNEWSPKNIRSKLSPSSTLSFPAGNKRPNLPSAQLNSAWVTGSGKVSQDFSVGISQRTSEFTPSQRQSFHSPAGTRLARFKHDLAQVMGS